MRFGAIGIHAHKKVNCFSQCQVPRVSTVAKINADHDLCGTLFC